MDIHFGLKSIPKIPNDDCEAFVDWFIEQAKQMAVKQEYSQVIGTPIEVL